MNAEVIAIGDELTSGARLDTNSQWISQRLAELGVTVGFHTTVADDLAANIEVFRAALQRVDVIVASGGLGPTADDLTREAIAGATATDLIRNDQALAEIRAKFQRRGQAMPKRNEVQALMPAGSRLVPNRHGTAPGIDMEIARTGRDPCRLFALPGVPSELRDMWAATVHGAIAELRPGEQVIQQRRIKCFGVGESRVEEMLPDLIRRGRTPAVGITVREATITLCVTAAGTTAEECTRAMQPTIRTIRECLGTLVFGEEDAELQHAVVELLVRAGATLATAEWGTGGLIADWLTEPTVGGETCYLGGVVIRSPKLMATVLTSEAEARYCSGSRAQPRSARSTQQLVQTLATACRERSGADYGLATGPLPAADRGGPPPRFYMGVAAPDGVAVESQRSGGHPAMARVRGAKQALNLLRLALIDRMA